MLLHLRGTRSHANRFESIHWLYKNRISSSTSCDQFQRAILAIGGNMGDRYKTILRALAILQDSTDMRLVEMSYLYESDPMYNTNQPKFLNGVLAIETSLDPISLLKRVKDVEKACGREISKKTGAGLIPNGPRPIDLDILFYGNNNEVIVSKDQPNLQIPHPRLHERDFVLRPLLDLDRSLTNMHPIYGKSFRHLHQSLSEDQPNLSRHLVRVIPLPHERFIRFDRTIVMGILNSTPDSFSDGGQFDSIENTVEKALLMINDGADIIDIGGESTRPGAKEVSIEEELMRTIPVISELRDQSDIPISIDTRHAKVAYEAICAGADIVNDVSGGKFDPDMFSTVAQLQVPMVIMHMRGIPENMQTLTEYKNNDVLTDVVETLKCLSNTAQAKGIPKWLHILDPGIGFAKTFDQSLSLLSNFDKLKDCLNNPPLLTGVSRKGFIGKITEEKIASNRDFGTAGVCSAIAVRGGSNIFRVHHVKGIKQAVMIVDAMTSSKNYST